MNDKNDYIEAAQRIIISLGCPERSRTSVQVVLAGPFQHGMICRVAWLAQRETLAARYAKESAQNRILVEAASGWQIALSPGELSEPIQTIIEDLASRFTPGSVLVYVGDTGDKWGYFDAPLLADLGVDVDSYGKMPDVALHDTERNWLLLVESVTSHGTNRW